jgi:hypothetical protein
MAKKKKPARGIYMLEIDTEMYSDSTWVTDCLDCDFRRTSGSEVDAYMHAKAHIRLQARNAAPMVVPAHRVLTYVANVIFKAESDRPDLQ